MPNRVDGKEHTHTRAYHTHVIKSTHVRHMRTDSPLCTNKHKSDVHTDYNRITAQTVQITDAAVEKSPTGLWTAVLKPRVWILDVAILVFLETSGDIWKRGCS